MTKINSRTIPYLLYSLLPFKSLIPSSEPIDIVIPIIEKDLKILPLCIDGVRNCVKNKINKIYIVAPKVEDIIDFCRYNDLVFLHENSILGIEPKDINLIIEGNNGERIDRSGWLFQQLLKLSGKIGDLDNYLCIDADHILIHPHVFLTSDNIPVFYMSEEKHLPYYATIKKLLPISKFSSLSYVAHKMIFNKKTLGTMHKEIENISGNDWITTIINNLDMQECSSFSEFELYGNYTKIKIHRPWKQKTLKSSSYSLSYKSLCDNYQQRYASLTFPDYLFDV